MGAAAFHSQRSSYLFHTKSKKWGRFMQLPQHQSPMCGWLQGFCMVGNSRLAKVMGSFDTARLMIGSKNSDKRSNYWMLDSLWEIKGVQRLFYHLESHNILQGALEVMFQSLKIDCIYHSFCFPWSAKNIQYLLKKALKISGGLHIPFYGFPFEKISE